MHCGHGLSHKVVYSARRARWPKHGGAIVLDNGYVCDRLDYCAPTDPCHQHQAGEQTAGKKEIPDLTRKSRILLVWCGSRLKCKCNGLSPRARPAMAMASSWWPCAGIWKWRCLRRRTNSTTALVAAAMVYGCCEGAAQRVTDGQ